VEDTSRSELSLQSTGLFCR